MTRLLVNAALVAIVLGCIWVGAWVDAINGAVR